MVGSILHYSASLVKDSLGLVTSIILRAAQWFTSSTLGAIHFVISSIYWMISTVVSLVVSIASFVVTTLLSIPKEILSFIYNHFALTVILTLCIPPAVGYLLYQRQQNVKRNKLINEKEYATTPRGSRATSSSNSKQPQRNY